MKLYVSSVNLSSASVTIRIKVSDLNDNYEIKDLFILRDIISFIPNEGDDITEELCDVLIDEANTTDAIKKGLNILSFGANSEAMLITKLRRRGVSPAHAKRASEYLKFRGYINDSNDVKRETERCLRKHWGLLRILSHLKNKGYDEDTIDAVEKSLSKVDFSLHCAKLISTNYHDLPTEPGERRRMISSLSRLGYSIDEIDRAVRLIKSKAI